MALVSQVKYLNIILLILSAVLLGGCSRLYFYPWAGWVQNPARQGLDYEDIILLHPGGMRIHGWWLPAEGKTRGTVYYLHGNAENVSTHLNSVQWLPAHGYNVFLLDYRGFGLSEGKPDIKGAKADIQLGLDWLKQSRRLQEQPLILYGQSLGASMSVNVMARQHNHGQVNCAIFEAGFAGYRDIARTIMNQSWLTWPFKWLIIPTLPGRTQDPVDNIGQLSSLPLLIMHSRDDQVIPYENGEALYQAATPPRAFLALRGDHTEGPQFPYVRRKMLQFMKDESCQTQ